MNDTVRFIARTAGAAVITVIALRGFTLLEKRLRAALDEEQRKNRTR